MEIKTSQRMRVIMHYLRRVVTAAAGATCCRSHGAAECASVLRRGHVCVRRRMRIHNRVRGEWFFGMDDVCPSIRWLAARHKPRYL
jgi:hypothetical protein